MSIVEKIKSALGMSRRQFIQAAATTAAASYVGFSSVGSQAAKPASGPVMPISLGWGFVEDESKTNEAFAAEVVRVMDNTLRRYNVVGWASEPQWSEKIHRGKQSYKLICRPIVLCDAFGHPIMRAA